MGKVSSNSSHYIKVLGTLWVIGSIQSPSNKAALRGVPWSECLRAEGEPGDLHREVAGRGLHPNCKKFLLLLAAFKQCIYVYIHVSISFLCVCN